jgi:hypothetical protein
MTAPSTTSPAGPEVAPLTTSYGARTEGRRP